LDTTTDPPDSATVPMVSVVVPVFNDPEGIRGCITALRRQRYAEDRYEIIVVDNGSTDATPAVLRELEIKFLVERSRRSSYAARNAGLRAAGGEVLAFTDADCTPDPGWLEQGVETLKESGAALVGGRVRFRLSARPRGAEIWDSITNMQVEQGIRERGVGKTANLFVERQVFDRVGPFSDELASGGDVAWTRRASRHGFEIAYAPNAAVEHPARRLKSLIHKQFRVGRGQAALRIDDGRSKVQIAAHTLRLLLPPSPGLVATQLATKEVSVAPTLFVRVWSAAWLSRAATGAGIAASLLVGRSARGAEA
jgi:cellulose synthase/poly-beta-1,6-N-acetylglucosamine synthase-like glycosyltransferase